MSGEEQPENGVKKVTELIELGKFYFLNQCYEQAIEKYTEALDLTPNDPDIYYNLGIVYESINRLDEAREMFEKAVDMKGDFEAAREHLDRIVGI
jgi:tetratricopeptide (TPR) repeat protein